MSGSEESTDEGKRQRSCHPKAEERSSKNIHSGLTSLDGAYT
jgi:hypothetical protein